MAGRTVRFFLNTAMVLMSALVCASYLSAQTTAQVPAPAAAGAISLDLKGAFPKEIKVGPEEWKVMARSKVTAKDHSGADHAYEGVTLQSLLLQASAPHGDEIRGKNMTLVVIAEGTDGYKAAFTLAELDGDFAGASVLVADTSDGKPLSAQEGPLRLVVPADKRQARCVQKLKSITLVNFGQ